MKHKTLVSLILNFSFLFFVCLNCGWCAEEGKVSSAELIEKAWAAHGNKDVEATLKYTQQVIDLYGTEAEQEQAILKELPKRKPEIEAVASLNDVATAYFIQGECFRDQAKYEEAIKAFKTVIDRYSFGQAWDQRGWFWSIKEKAEVALNQLETGKIEEEEKEEKAVVTKLELYDEGTEFPVNYSKYGEFIGLGTTDYRYVIKDQIGLSKATGEGIYPNTSSLKFDPEFIKIKKELVGVDHWQALNSRDYRTAFYKWNIAPETSGMQQFSIADILERSGYLKHAIKAYYAVLVHYPKEYGWTYWHTPWYIGKAALYRIKYLLREHPELELKLEDASIEIINGFDYDVRNDIFVVNPGRLVKFSLWDKLYAKAGICREKPRKFGKITKSLGGDKVKLVRYESGDWQMLVEGNPFIIKGITYAPTRVGESPDKGTLENWTVQDTNHNGLIDAPFEAWVDKNTNDIQDKDEAVKGDFFLMKEMGVNCLRLYHQPAKINKELIRQMYAKYGIYIILGDFLGKYALGSNAPWDPGTDYDDPLHRENMLASVKEMVLEFKDEPYVLFWILGNENVYGVACNANKKPESFFKFANEAARLIKSLDPRKRPVAIASGDTLFLDIFAKNCPDIDIFGSNCYRGRYGFLDLWDEVERLTDKPAFITEYGAPSYAKGYTLSEGEEFQALYHWRCWQDIFCNSGGFGAGNAVGGIVFEWLDEWWKAYEPSYHDKKGLFTGPFLDGYMHEEWLGLVGQGNGKHSPFLRQLKKSYYAYQELWNEGCQKGLLKK